MIELEFINVVLFELGCLFLFDVNNVYVNSINYWYDFKVFIDGLLGNKIVYGYIVGYYEEVEDLCVDIYGVDVIEEVWVLLVYVYW